VISFKDLGEALATGIDLHFASLTNTSATVAYTNFAELDEQNLSTPQIVVTPNSMSSERTSRTMSQVDMGMHVYVGQKAKTDSEVDSIMGLSDIVFELLRSHDYYNLASWPDGVTSPQNIGIDINPDGALQDRNLWRCVFDVEFRIFVEDVIS
jgi:hypothetical protein